MGKITRREFMKTTAKVGGLAIAGSAAPRVFEVRQSAGKACRST